MPQQTASYFDFDKIAAKYDRWYDSARGTIYDRLEKDAIDKLLTDIAKRGRLLEIGCGTGHWSRYFSDKGYEVTGIDVSVEMINIARQKHIPNCRFEISDGRNLPFEDESFDAAAAITIIEFTAEPEKIILEMIRCVKKSKGILIFGVLNALNGYNQKKKNRPGSMYSLSHLFSPQKMQDLLDSYGIPKMRIAGFVPEKEWLLGVSPLWERLGLFFRSQRGAFIAVRVDL